MGSRVVVVGGGHGGLRVAQQLAARLGPEDHLTLVARENYFLYYPFLRDLVAGAAEMAEVAFPLRELVPRGARFVNGTLESVSQDGHQLRVRLPDDESIPLACDHLVLALGGTTSYHDTDGAKENAIPFKSAEDALRLRARLLGALESRAAGGVGTADVVIVGGGYTGLEVAGAIHDLLRRAHRGYGAPLASHPPRIHVIEGEDQLLPGMPDDISAYARNLLAARGDHVVLGEHVEKVDEDGVRLKGGARIPAAAVVWSAGVVPSPALASLPFPRDEHGRLVVDEHLRVQAGVWAVGDCAGAMQHGKPVAMTAQAAEAEARVVAGNVVRDILGRELEAFHHRSRGMIVPLGEGLGAAEMGKRVLTGRSAGLLWRAFHLAQLPGVARKMRYVGGWMTGAPRERALIAAPTPRRFRSNRRPS